MSCSHLSVKVKVVTVAMVINQLIVDAVIEEQGLLYFFKYYFNTNLSTTIFEIL